MKRRDLVSTAAGFAALTALGFAGHDGDPLGMQYRHRALARFVGWLERQQPVNGEGLLVYFERDLNSNVAPAALSVLASCDAALWCFNQNLPERALQIADGLVRWHARIQREVPAKVRAGFPTEIKLSLGGGWNSGDYFYASDNLLAIELMCRAYAISGDQKYVDVALAVARWLRETLFDGKRLGVWSKNYGPPMAYMRSDGAVLNSISTSVDYLWIGVLNKLHTLERTSGWNEQFREAIHFYSGAQSEYGCWYDHFTPIRYDRPAGRWHWHRGGNQTIGDNNLRSALASIKYGKLDQVNQFMQWLKPVRGVHLWGYLDPDTGGHSFVKSDTPYFDIVCTGLLAELYRQLKHQDKAALCESQLLKYQDQSGGWAWARRPTSLRVHRPELATLTGLWALGSCL